MKSNNREFVEIGTFIDIASKHLVLTIYITDFKPDLEGVSGADFVEYYTEPSTKRLIGKKIGSTFIQDKSKYKITSIVKKAIKIDNKFLGSIELLDDNKSFKYSGEHGDYRVIKSLSGHLIENSRVNYLNFHNPGSIVKNRRIQKKMRKKTPYIDQFLEFIKDKEVQSMILAFSSGIRLEYNYHDYFINFNSTAERNLIIEKLSEILNIKPIKINTLKINTTYYLNESGLPDELIFED